MTSGVPRSIRRLGQGYEPDVDEVDGRLVYSIPVDSGVAGAVFAFEIEPGDLDVLLAEPYRRLVLQWALHTLLQRSMIRGNAPVTEPMFRDLASRVLFAAPDELSGLIDALDADHNIRLRVYVERDLKRLNGTDA